MTEGLDLNKFNKKDMISEHTYLTYIIQKPLNI
jgi:hypothetical protein